MATQEEIREGIKYELCKRKFNGESFTPTEYAKGIVKRLHSQGVVIKTHIPDGWLLVKPTGKKAPLPGYTSVDVQVDIGKSIKIVAIEPLIEEER